MQRSLSSLFWCHILAAWRSALLVAAVLMFCSAGARGQICPLRWSNAADLSSGFYFERIVAASVDETSQPPRMVIAGYLEGTTPVPVIVSYDGTSWQTLLTFSAGSQVTDLAVLNGEIFISGKFLINNRTNVVAKVVAGTLNAIGSNSKPEMHSTNDRGYCLEVYRGELYLGGNFNHLNGQIITCLARWDGNIWHSVDLGMPDTVHTLTAFNNKLYIGSQSLSFRGETMRFMAIWDGATLSTVNFGHNLPPTFATATSSAYYVLSVDNYYTYTTKITKVTPSGVTHLVVNPSIVDIYEENEQTYFLGSNPSSNSPPLVYQLVNNQLIAVQHSPGPAQHDTYSIRLTFNGQKYLLGSRTTWDEPRQEGNHLWRYGSNGWETFSPDFTHPTLHAVSMWNSRVVLGGDFVRSTYANLGIFDGNNVVPLGGGSPNGAVRSIFTLADGRLLIGGEFDEVGGVQTGPLAAWNGTSWSAYAPGLSAGSYITSMTLHGGMLVVAGNGVFNNVQSGLFVWNGSGWSNAGATIAPQGITTVASYQGRLLVGGEFTYLQPQPVRNLGVINTSGASSGWAWSAPMGECDGPVDYIAFHADRALISGRFQSIGTVMMPHSVAYVTLTSASAVPVSFGDTNSGVAVHNGASIVLRGTSDAAGDAKVQRVLPPAQVLSDVQGQVLLPAGGVFSAGQQLYCLGSTLITGTDGAPNYIKHGQLFRAATQADPLVQWEASLPTFLCLNTPISVTCRLASLVPETTFQWYRNGVLLNDIPGEISGTSTSQLTFSRFYPRHAGNYYVRVTNACGNAQTVVKSLRYCVADNDCNGVVNAADRERYFTAHSQGEPWTDLNSDGNVNASDITLFNSAYAQGICRP